MFRLVRAVHVHADVGSLFGAQAGELHTEAVKMQASHFLRGDNKRGWKASFDWLFENDKNWVKVYEGNYDNLLDPPTRYVARNSGYGKNCNDEWK